MRQLSGLDAGFLYIESEQAPMHVGSLTLYQRPSEADGSFAHTVLAHVQSRVHLAPIFHQRLALMPLDLGHPVWVEAGELDYDYHFVVHNLARGKKLAKQAALEDLVASLHEPELDRARPLWQFHFIEGLEHDRVGFYAKVHHAALDGAAGILLANALLDLTAIPRTVAPPEAGKAKANPSRSKLMGSLFSNTFAQYAKLARSLPSAVKRVADAAMAKGVSGTIAATRELGSGFVAPKTPFNVSIESKRRFAMVSVPLAEIKAVSAACEASVNDVVMAICSGALRRFLLDLDALPERSLIAAVPISLRELGDERMNNQVTMVPCALGTEHKTAEKRLAATKSAMGELKAATAKFKDLIPTDYPSLGAPWLIGGLAQLLAKTKLVDRLSLPANLVISNVPGPKVPLYLAGAKMLHYFPVSIVIHGMGLNITVHSYAGQLDFGLVACAKAVPDLAPLASAIALEHDALKALAAQRLLGTNTPAKTAARKSASVAEKAPAKSSAKAPAKLLSAKATPANTPSAKSASAKTSAVPAKVKPALKTSNAVKPTAKKARR
jgi:diacylglycerol O-acyltransferase / wax synthase